MAKSNRTPRAGNSQSDARKAAHKAAVTEIHSGIHNALCSLTCAKTVLDLSSAVDGDENAARARNVIHHVIRQLDALRTTSDICSAQIQDVPS